MQCDRCGGQIGNKITRINGVTLCEKCARNYGVDMSFGNNVGRDFSFFSELTNAIMATGTDLEFTSSKISCPRCGTRLREFEVNNKVGCIECYNFFNDSIVKTMLRLQGSTEYKGRKPGEESGIEVVSEEKPVEEPKITEVKTEPSKEEVKDKKSLYEKLLKADLGMVSDEDLEEAMKQSVANEDYKFAAKLRDELKSRKGGTNNVE